MSSGRLYKRLKAMKRYIRHLKNGNVTAYETWSFSRGSNYKALTGKNVVFWHVVAYGRWSLKRGGRT